MGIIGLLIENFRKGYRDVEVQRGGLKKIRACWEFVLGDKKDVFFGLMMSNFLGIAVALSKKFEEIRQVYLMYQSS